MSNIQPGYPTPQPPPARQTSGLAVVSLVMGILSWLLLPILGSLTAIITGHMARSEIRRQPERMDGDGLAIAGLVLGYAQLIVSLLALLVVFLFFGGIIGLLSLDALTQS